MKRDKIQHFVGGMVVAILCVGMAAVIADLSQNQFAAVALITGMLSGVVKEIYDGATGRGVVDIWDAVANTLGGATVSAVILAV